MLFWGLGGELGDTLTGLMHILIKTGLLLNDCITGAVGSGENYQLKVV